MNEIKQIKINMKERAGVMAVEVALSMREKFHAVISICHNTTKRKSTELYLIYVSYDSSARDVAGFG